MDFISILLQSSDLNNNETLYWKTKYLTMDDILPLIMDYSVHETSYLLLLLWYKWNCNCKLFILIFITAVFSSILNYRRKFALLLHSSNDVCNENILLHSNSNFFKRSLLLRGPVFESWKNFKTLFHLYRNAILNNQNLFIDW